MLIINFHYHGLEQIGGGLMLIHPNKSDSTVQFKEKFIVFAHGIEP